MDGLTAEEAQMFHDFDKRVPLVEVIKYEMAEELREMDDEVRSEKNKMLFFHNGKLTLADVYDLPEEILVDVGAKTKYYGNDIDQFTKESLDTKTRCADRIDSRILKLEKHQLSELVSEIKEHDLLDNKTTISTLSWGEGEVFLVVNYDRDLE